MRFSLKAALVGSLLMLSQASHAGLISANDGTAVTDVNTTTDLVFDINEFGRMTGAFNVLVNGELYDLVFRNTTAGDANDNRIANSREEATDFAQAIIDQVLIDGPAGMFDSDFTLVEGCQEFANVFRCGLGVPYGLIERLYLGQSHGFDYKMMNARSVNGEADRYGNQERPSEVGLTASPKISDKI